MFGVTTSSNVNEPRGKIICGRFLSINAHAEHERSECNRTGDCSSIQKPYNGHDSQKGGDLLHDATETENKKKRTLVEHGELRCMVCQSGWRNSLNNFVDEEASASSEASASISREPLHQERSIKVVWCKHSIFIYFPKDEIAKSARGPKR